MSLLLSGERAWWSTNSKYPSLQVKKSDIYHVFATTTFLQSHPELEKERQEKGIDAQTFMQELGFIRTWLTIFGELHLQGRKESFQKILPDILKFIRMKPQISKVLFDYYTEMKKNNPYPNYKDYLYIPNQSLISQLSSELS